MNGIIKNLKVIYRALVKDRLILVNFIFQRALGINRGVPIPVNFTSRVVCAENIFLGTGESLRRSFALSGGCYFSAVNGIQFGNNVLFAPGIKILSSNHALTPDRAPLKSEPVVIGDDVWIGTNAVILPSVKIGGFAVIAAGAIVNQNVPSRAIVAGVPAKVLAYICHCGTKLKVQPSIVCPECRRQYRIDMNKELVPTDSSI